MNSIHPDTPRLIDISHAVEHGMITYRGLPAPIISDHLSREESTKHYSAGTQFHIGKIEMVANTGTYLDSPFHRYEDGKDLSQLSLSSVANLEGICIRASDLVTQAVDASLFHESDVKGRAVLVHTGWDVHWGTELYFDGHPFLTKDVAQFLVDAGARLVGIDSLNIDDIRDTTRPVHSMLLKAGIPVVEHLCNLGALPDDGFRFFAVPVKVKGMGTFPVRAFGIID
ncbi:MAG TPA: cyclase family protein [Pyrinomonadaceae bacterium]|nr:cyclase family protein [Pyrinomonadaceae bacterium]